MRWVLKKTKKKKQHFQEDIGTDKQRWMYTESIQHSLAAISGFRVFSAEKADD